MTEFVGSRASGHALVRWFRDTNVRPKILTAVGLSAAVAVAVGTLSIWAQADAATRADKLYAENVEGVSAVEDLGTAIASMRIDVRNAVLAQLPSGKKTAEVLLGQHRADFDAAAAAYADLPLDGARRKELGELQKAVDDFMVVQKKVLLPLAERNDLPYWWVKSELEAQPLVDAMLRHTDALTAAEAVDASASAAEAHHTYARNRLITLILLFVGIFLSVLLGWLVANATARRVARVGDVARALADGDLTRRADLDSSDDVGTMGAALDEATEQLRALIGSVVGSADAVAAASEELSASSQQIAAGAEETSVQADVVAGAADEVSRNVQTVAAGAEQMGASIREIAASANDAARVATEAVTIVERTNET
ncbi:methyl-accepting chemotaxis protein, partial [Nocardioides sp. Root224]